MVVEKKTEETKVVAWEVVEDFPDLDGTEYKKGDEYPKKGTKVSDESFTRWSTTYNPYGFAFIKKK